ncbi:efflux RND transporter periplasmic adaptor subunit [Castellaniella sp.]|uniref:efflux RND transporter periplasmic adaptor subunit n=1 Tax=Castellaniella sp. TaxID=1955812 RepID=UPI002AFE07D3|nr:efflux RND transporter periplasmic adaptor subunit [Castellaniella sp.]
MAISSVRRSFLWWGLAALLILGAWGWWSGRPAPASAAENAAAPPVLVHTATVAARDMPIRIQGLGAVQAWASVTVRARIDGQLESVGFREGEVVRQGQLIARLDDRTQKAQLAQAIAQRVRDQAQLDNAREDLARYVELARHGAIDRKTLDTQRAQVAVLQATVQSDEAQIQAARVQLDYTRITAPLTGRTGALRVDPGNLVRATDADGLVLINQIDPIAVSFTVPDTAFAEVQAAVRAAHAVRAQAPADGAASGSPSVAGGEAAGAAAAHPVPGLAVEVYGRGRPELLGRGALVLVDNQIDAASGTLRLKARLDNPGQGLWPGQTVDVRLILGDRAGALVVPESAVQRGAQGLYVYVVEPDGRVRPQTVRMAVAQDGLAVVTEGLSAGQRVVVDGQYKLRPGLKIAEAAAEAADAAPPGGKAAPAAPGDAS